MTPLIEMSEYFRETYLEVETLMLVVSVYCIVLQVLRTAPFKTMILPIVLFFLETMGFVMLYVINYDATYGKRPEPGIIYMFCRTPWIIHVILTAAIITAYILMILRVVNWPKNNISRFSISEGAEYLDNAFVLAYPNGQVIRCNRKADELTIQLTGHPIVNSEELHQELMRGELLPGCRLITNEPLLLEDSEKRVWLFTRKELRTAEDIPFIEFTAVDVTEERRLSDELARDSEKLKQINRQLAEYNMTVDEVVKEEEQLATKIRVHDNMGESLLSARIFLSGQESMISPEKLLYQWQRDVAVLSEEAAEKDHVQSQIDRLKEAASFLGIELFFMGDMPKDEGVIRIITTAVQECMTNAVAHAQATQMYTSVVLGNETFHVTISNNGSGLKEGFREGGGLSYVREMTEAAGGVIRYGSGPRFRMELTLPEKLKGR